MISANTSSQDAIHDVDIPNEPPPAYDAIPSQPPPSSQISANPQPTTGNSSSSNSNSNQPSSSTAPTHHPPPSEKNSRSNPFLQDQQQQPSVANTPANLSSSVTNPFADENAPSSSSNRPPPTPNPASPPPTTTTTNLSPNPSLSVASTASPRPATSIIANNAPPSPSTSISSQNLAAASPSPSTYAPPQGPPPPTLPPRTRPTSSSPPVNQNVGGTPAAPPANSGYNPTSTPTPGQPLLRFGRLLVYPKNWPGCSKCGNTGYKHGDPTHPCRKCWDKYGKTFSGALQYSVGLNDSSVTLQKPLPVVGLGTGPPGQAGGGGPYSGGVQTWIGPGRRHGPCSVPAPAGYPSASYRPPAAGNHQQHYASPSHPPPPNVNHYAPPLSPPPNRDAETEAQRAPDAPPNYPDASSVGENERLPPQFAAPPHPPPPTNQSYGGYGPPAGNQYRPPPPQQAYRPPPSSFPPHAPGFHPIPGARGNPPPGALVVMPGDPRIGGRLCHECGGRGLKESFWFGDETCFRCRGAGRVF
ncbi:hypothetical protein IE53DRAFT_388573 [Violaceomyces palustris]|uniref:Uncharacterized protein n=1 Tax=Violaceomyces palustris TaxID=1673888 RepID=A0ACD0NTW0_9BASI|nr:hypothetical protein IE53DRAFT_388573 [Violaceomyces palustris]